MAVRQPRDTELLEGHPEHWKRLFWSIVFLLLFLCCHETRSQLLNVVYSTTMLNDVKNYPCKAASCSVSADFRLHMCVYI